MKRCFLFSVLVLVIISSYRASEAQMAPALFVFGDSLVDVGNNNYLPWSIAKGDYPHYGIDFPNHKPTGRFSNGKNCADFIAEKVGLPSPPPYLALVHNKSNNFLAGASFASGGSGIFYGLDRFFGQVITMDKQIEYFSTVQQEMVQQLGASGAEKILSKALFVVVMGSNDVIGYFNKNMSSIVKGTPQERVDSMIGNMTAQLQQIYDLGGRRFAMFGVGPVGCCPYLRTQNKTGACHAEANFWASQYNQRLMPVLEQFKSQLSDFEYMYFDTYSSILNVIGHAADYGIIEVKAACCGIGTLNAQLSCLPIASYCPNRTNHLFWDFFHPTENVARIAIDAAFDGPQQYTSPMNLRQFLTSKDQLTE